MLRYIQIFCGILSSFVLTNVFLPIFIKIATNFNIVDRPDGVLKKHEKVTPYLGGVAIFFGFLIPVLFTLRFERALMFFILGCAALVLLGLLDDKFVFSPLTKICGQLVASMCFVFSGAVLHFSLFPYWINFSITIFWYLSIINAFNLVDIMDGLCASIGACVTLALLVYASFQSNIFMSIVLSCLLGAILAFFMYNKPPAKIYLGDAGSMFIGGVLSYASISMNWGGWYFNICMPIILFGLLLVELCSLVLIRTYKGISFFRGSPDHFCHYLLARSYTKHQILALSSLCCVVFFMFSLLLLFFDLHLHNLLLFVAIFVAFWLKTLFF